MSAVALIVAAGRGERLGMGKPIPPKAFVSLAGRPMLEWSVAALRDVGEIEQIVIAMPPGEERPPAGCTAVPGGATRSHSVAAALAAARPGLDPVLVHDAARPLLSAELAARVLAACSGDEDAAIAAARVTDTIKEGGELVERTLDRSRLWAVQTPQVFRRAALERALDVGEDVLAAATDDAWLVERQGGGVRLVESPRENLKVTTPVDLRLAELLLAERAQATGEP